MIGKSIRIFAFCVTGIFIATIAVSAVHLSVSSVSGREKAQQQFSLLTEEIQRMFDESLLLSDIYESAWYAAERNRAFAVLTILPQKKQAGADYPFIYPASSQFFSYTQDGEPVLRIHSPLIKIFTSAVSSHRNEVYAVTAAVFVLSPAEIYRVGKTAFFIILCCTAAVFCVLMAAKSPQNSIKNNRSRRASDSGTDADGEAEKTEDGTQAGNGANETSDASDKMPPEQQNENGMDTETDAQQKTTEESALHGTQPDGEILDEADNPQGLFSQATGVGWKQYLLPRLDAELERAAAAEEDLTIVLVRFKHLSNADSYIKEFSEALVDIVKFKDLIFEYSDGGFACILTDADIAVAMIAAEKIYTRFYEILRQFSPEASAAVGISSRKSRLVSGERLLKEADLAVDKAFEEQTMPIVAFSANSEKYKNHITAGN
ncbi:MAG: diguanylate cyclase [Bacteroides sp.]|nr:diguanylate cyclase [Prevotella sp.]MCM1407284.1 diguanylate cyclase [Treponema brennaborense]MCM1469772.1 diguanylate cyclase [Bacteroides sp.]